MEDFTNSPLYIIILGFPIYLIIIVIGEYFSSLKTKKRTMKNHSSSDAIAKIVKTVRSCNTRTQLEHAYAWGREWLCKKRSEIGAARFSNYMEILSYVYRMRSFQIWEAER